MAFTSLGRPDFRISLFGMPAPRKLVEAVVRRIQDHGICVTPVIV